MTTGEEWVRLPPAELAVDEGVVRTLVASAGPRFSDLPIEFVGEGWDNTTWRLGDSFAVRLPRRESAVELTLREQRWLPELLDGVTLGAPVPVYCGEPSDDFPWPWTIVRWVEGRTAAEETLDAASVDLLARELLRLHQPVSEDAPRSPYRGLPLAERDASVRSTLETVAKLDPPGAHVLPALWTAALRAPTQMDEGRPDVWLHGDLHPRNVVVRRGRLAGLIDWGDLCRGDRATDLSAFWMLFEPEAARRGLEAVGATAPERLRAVGWSVVFAGVYIASGEPTMAAPGRRILGHLAALDPASI